MYKIAFSDRRQSRHPTFAAFYRRVAEIRSVTPQIIDRGRPSSARTTDQKEHILHALRDDSGINIRHTTQRRVPQEQLLYPYNLQPMQRLSHSDHSTRETLVYCTISPSVVFLLILFMDVATFGRDGMTNLHNQDLWADRKLRDTSLTKTSMYD